MIKVDFIGIGVHKGATTWLSDMLIQHPSICIPYIQRGQIKDKELQFFNDYTHFGKERGDAPYCKGIGHYFSLFKECKNGTIKGEISTQYMQEEHVASRIYKNLPDVKILAILRNPIDRAYSAYNFLRHRLYLDNSRNFEEAIQSFPEEYLERGLYHKKLKPYFKLFPRGNIHIIIFDDIVSQPENVLKSVCKFLGVDETHSFQKASGKVNVSRRSKNKFLGRTLDMFFKVPDTLERVKLRCLTDAVSALGARQILNKIRDRNMAEYRYPKMSDKTRRTLKSYYRNDLIRLEGLIGRDLSMWYK